MKTYKKIDEKVFEETEEIISEPRTEVRTYNIGEIEEQIIKLKAELQKWQELLNEAHKLGLLTGHEISG